MRPSEFIDKIGEDLELDIKMIFKESKADSNIDIESVDKEIVRNVNMQVKWNCIRLSLMEILSDLELEAGKERADILKYWKSLKEDKPKKYIESSEIKLLIAGDPDVIVIVQQINKYKNILSYIDKFMKTLDNKHFAIGHFIEFKKATNGFV